MNTLLLRLAAPMQSWGVDSKFERRGTERFPTKSGIIGLIASALGRKRNESLEDLCKLTFGVRVDRQGVLIRDFHTAKGEKDYITQRYYLSDAVFLAGVEGEEEFINKIHFALQHPVFPLFLGRRSCPPEGKLLLGIRYGKSVKEALEEEEWQVREELRGKEGTKVVLPIIIEGLKNQRNTFSRRDTPESFNPMHRKFKYTNLFYSVSKDILNTSSYDYRKGNSTTHNPMSMFEEE